MDFLQRPIPRPELKITVHRAARRKVLRQMPPLAASFQRIQQTVHHLPEVRRALAPATLARRDQRFDHRPLLVAKVTRITQPVTPIPLPALRSPQGAPPLFEHPLESQQIHPIQQVCGRALTAFVAGLLLTAAYASSAQANNFVVNNTTDEGDTNLADPTCNTSLGIGKCTHFILSCLGALEFLDFPIILPGQPLQAICKILIVTPMWHLPHMLKESELLMASWS